MIPLVHANGVLAGRGSIDVLSVIFQQLQGFAGDFDAYEQVVPKVLRSAFDFVNKTSKQRRGPRVEAQEACFVGWSERRQSMACRYVFHNEKAGGESSDVPWLSSPGMDLVPDSPAAHALPDLASTPEGMLQLSGQQLAWGASKNAQADFGGRLLVAVITRDELRVRPLGSIEMPPQLAN